MSALPIVEPAPPTVSIVLPTFNERAYIRDCLASLAAQDYGEIVEILVIDGGSTDGTVDIAESFGQPVRVLPNPRVSAAAALNVGLAAATGDIVCRADAHALYAGDYVSRCVELLLESGAQNVGGPMRPVGTNAFGRAVAAATSSKLGVGPGRFHLEDASGAVDTVYLGCWWRDTLESLGGWDETSLQWAAEDHELNFRLRKQGGTILLDPEIRSVYFPRDTWRGLARQYANYGTGKVSTLVKHRALPTLRPLAPATLLGAFAIGGIAGAVARKPWIAAVLPSTYAVGVLGAGAVVKREPGVPPHRTALAIATCHVAYGYGFWRGLWRVLVGKGFDSRPRRGRR
jgi:GT2 family glycosyltransferase